MDIKTAIKTAMQAAGKNSVKIASFLGISKQAFSIFLNGDFNQIERIIKMSSDEGDIILDPFLGSGTSVIAAANLNRKGIGFELDTKYEPEIKSRIKNEIKNYDQIKMEL